ncbi:gas vesicle protein K [Micromonospora echinofusca]|uniref:Gas vesicle protein K n=1 Tax=Micromonospora echinofusca TaxID=47858 RepID=A0A1C5G1S9_MICEH|nr:gas vesicle protein K [Micromonospora echinofusca]SCG13845.1 Gas vesicle protein K [Micromonospora echinofusca]
MTAPGARADGPAGNAAVPGGNAAGPGGGAAGMAGAGRPGGGGVRRDEAAELAAALGDTRWQPPRVTPLDRRLAVDRDSVERGLASLVLTVIELLRQLMERQALRRVDLGDLTEEQVERIGTTLMALEEQMTGLREYFGLAPEDLNLDLGPLGPLLPTD